MSIAELTLRLLIAFVTLLALTRLMGRKEIAQMTFFNSVSAISIGTLGASLAIDDTLSIRNGLIALAGWSAFTLILGYLDIKSAQVHNAIVGRPVILIRQGRIMEGALRKARLDLDALSGLLRKKNVFAVADVDYAWFETDGSLSVMKKETRQPVTKGDMNIQPADAVFPASMAVISDGRINQVNLTELNLNDHWLDQQLEAAGMNAVADVFYAEVHKDGTLYMDNKEDYHR